MILFKIAVTATAVLTMASAWSAQFSQFFHTFPPPPPLPPPPHHHHPPPMPLTFRPFFQDSLIPRYYVHQPQFFRQPPLQMYQQQPTTRLPSTTNDVHHHHHVFYYYYLPATGVTYDSHAGRDADRGVQVTRQSCDDHRPVTVSPPVYLPPPPTTTKPPPPPPPPSPPPTVAPCNDDTVVVDNIDYYPFGRSPIVVAAAARGRDVQDYRGPENVPRKNSGLQNKSNFILANYLLPPDK